MQNCLLGWPNRFTFGTISASAQEAALPATNLANDQGAAEEAWQCPGTSGTVTLAMSADATWRLFGLFRTNLTGTATVRWKVLTAAGAVAWDSGVQPASVYAGYGQSVTVAPPDAAGQRVVCEISDPANPDGHLNIPLAYAGDAWQPISNMDYGTTPGRTAQVGKALTRSGGVVIRPDWVKRTYALSMSAIRNSEVYSKVMDLDLYARRGNNVLFVPNPASEIINAESLFGEFEPGGNVTYPERSFVRRGYAATLTERL